MQERLEPYVQKTDYCWVWTGGTNKAGYGRLYFQGKFWLAHRLMYIATYGEIADNLLVRHYECDNPPCVNPAHLLTGTVSDNMQDAIKKNRHAHGARVPQSKLTDADIPRILADKRIHELIALDYGVTRRAIDRIFTGQSWKHVPRP